MHNVTHGVTNFVLVVTSLEIEVLFLELTQWVQTLLRLVCWLIRSLTFHPCPISCPAGCLCAVLQDVNIKLCYLLVPPYVGPLMTQIREA